MDIPADIFIPSQTKYFYIIEESVSISEYILI